MTISSGNQFDAIIVGAGPGGSAIAALLATALKAAGKNDQEVIMATKWWPLLRTVRNIPRTNQEHIRLLDGYSIGLYMVHQPFSFSSLEAGMEL